MCGKVQRFPVVFPHLACRILIKIQKPPVYEAAYFLFNFFQWTIEALGKQDDGCGHVPNKFGVVQP